MTSAHLRTEKPDTSQLIIDLMGVLGRSAIRPRTLSCSIDRGCQRALRAPSLRRTEWLHYRSARYLATAAAAIIWPTATERLFEAAGYVPRHLLQALRIHAALVRDAHQPFASCGSRLAQLSPSIGCRFR